MDLLARTKSLLWFHHGESAPELDCAAFLSHQASKINSKFGLLAHFAALRDPETGRYCDHLLTQMFPAEEVHEALRRLHAEVFVEWLNLSLSQQVADLAWYLSSDGDQKQVLNFWVHSGINEYLPPPQALDAERRLFSKDLSLVLGFLANQK